MPFLVAILVVIAGGSAVAYADSEEKRERDARVAAELRRKIDRITSQIARAETQMARLRETLGVKNQQVRDLAAEIERLRGQLTLCRAS